MHCALRAPGKRRLVASFQTLGRLVQSLMVPCPSKMRVEKRPSDMCSEVKPGGNREWEGSSSSKGTPCRRR